MNRQDRRVVSFAFLITVLLAALAVLMLWNAKWFQNPGHAVFVPSRVVRMQTVVISPSAVATATVTKTKTATKTVTVATPVPSPVLVSQAPATVTQQVLSEPCIEALRAADALRRAVQNGQDATAEAYNYQSYRSLCH